MTLIKSISGIRGTIGGGAGEGLNPLDIVKFTSAYATLIRNCLLYTSCGLVSLYFTRAMNSVEGVFGRLRTPYKKLIMGGAMLSILCLLYTSTTDGEHR